jgi:hypothetical protein
MCAKLQSLSRRRMSATSRGRSVAARRVSISEGRKRAFPGDALARFPHSTERPYVRAGRRGMNGRRGIWIILV